jgi:hypothetical protein
VPNEENPGYTSRYFMSALGKIDDILASNERTIKNHQTSLPLYKEMLKSTWPADKEAKLQELIKESQKIDESIRASIEAEKNKTIPLGQKSELVEISAVEEPKAKYNNNSMGM